MRTAGRNELNPEVGPFAGYVKVRSPGAAWLVRPEGSDEARDGRLDFLLEGAVVRRSGPGGGRAPLARLRLGGHEAIGKRSLHGGLLGPLLGGLHLSPGRAVSLIHLTARLERCGIATPEILAVGWRRRALLFVVQAMVTRAIPRAQNLYEAAIEDAPWRRRRAILARSADLVRSMHDAGFLHADLNVTNLVLGGGPTGDLVYVVDLDKGRFLPDLDLRRRFDGLARLLRSYEKWVAGRAPLTARDEMSFLWRYCRSDGALFRDLQGSLQRYRRRLRLRRLTWRLLTGRQGAARVGERS